MSEELLKGISAGLLNISNIIKEASNPIGDIDKAIKAEILSEYKLGKYLDGMLNG